MNRLIKALLLCVCPLGLLAFAAGFLSGQEFRATLTGTVTDPTGAVVPNATVEAVNHDTQQKYDVTTTAKGDYFIPYMLPGTYRVSVTAPGFQTKAQDNVVLEASTSRGLNFQLALGQASQTVEVTSAPPLLENTTASNSTILSGRELESVPLNGRQIYTLIGTTPGSQFTGGTSGTRGWDTTGNYVIGGGVSHYQQFTLNGTNITVQTSYQSGSNGEWTLAPNIDALQEANVMTTTYDARYGRTGGGTVNMVVKSGSNQLHGTLYEYLENTVMDANYYQNNINGVARPGLIQNQFGGTVGGAIKKDKIFYFGSFEGYRERLPQTGLFTVPPAYLRPGPNGVNFNNTALSGTLYTVYDPSTTFCVGGGTLSNCPSGKFARNPFPNNTIPQSAISPVGAAILNLYPMPNTNVNALNNNYLGNLTGAYEYNQPMVRVDYDTSDKTRWYSLFAFQHGTENRSTNGMTGVAAQGNFNHTRQDITATQDMTHIFTPTLLADFKLSFSRFMDFGGNGDFSKAVNPSTIGLNMPNIPTTTLKDLPEISLNSFTGVVGNNVTDDVWNNIVFDNDWTKTLSNHTLHFGGELGEFQFADPRTVQRPNGYFTFSSRFTQYNPLQGNTLPGVHDGYPVADLLLGYPDTGTNSQSGSGVDWADTIFEGYPTWALYVQDDWKATRRLTINIGLRYDVQVGVRERHNLLARGACLNCVNPITNEAQYQANVNNPANQAAWTAAGINPASLQTAYGGLVFAGVNGESRDAYNTDWSNWEPRLGFAYQVNSKTVIRGGYGIEYAIGLEGGSSDPFSVTTSYVGSLNNNVTPTNYFATGNPFPNGVSAPTGNTLGLLTGLGNVKQLDYPQRRIPRSQIFSFGFQRELPGHMVLDARFAGNYTDRLRLFVWLNGTMPLSQYQQAIANPNYFNKQVPNPYYNVPNIPSNSTMGSSPTVPAEDLLTPFSEFLRIGEYDDPLGYQTYNALEVKLNKHLLGAGRGLSFQLAYTYSKALAATSYTNGWPYQDAHRLYQPTSSDRTQIFTITGQWAIPVGRGSSLLSNAPKVVDAFIGGWNLDWVFNWQSGTPVGLSQGWNYTCGHPYTPDGGPTMGNYIYNNYSNGSSTGCWQSLPPFFLPYLPNRISTLRNFSIPNLDLSLAKNFSLTERLRLQFRADAFNVTNSVLFGGPDNNPNDGVARQQSTGCWTGFGTVGCNQANTPRVLQMSLKLAF